MASIVGTWEYFFTWRYDALLAPDFHSPADFTFNANGTWTAGSPHPRQMHGWWLQAGDLAMWYAATDGIVWSANVRASSLVPNDFSMAGIMAYWDRRDLGTFRMTRFVPDELVGAVGRGVPEDNRDPLLGPVVDAMPGDGSDRAAEEVEGS